MGHWSNAVALIVPSLICIMWMIHVTNGSPVAGGQSSHHLVHEECLPICAVRYELPLCMPCDQTKTIPYCTSAATLPTCAPCHGKNCHNNQLQRHGLRHEPPHHHQESHHDHDDHHGNHHGHAGHSGDHLGPAKHPKGHHGHAEHHGRHQQLDNHGVHHRGPLDHHGSQRQYDMLRKGDGEDPHNPKYALSKEVSHGDHQKHHQARNHNQQELAGLKDTKRKKRESKKQHLPRRKRSEKLPLRHPPKSDANIAGGNKGDQIAGKNLKQKVTGRRKRAIKGIELLPDSVEGLLSSSLEKLYR